MFYITSIISILFGLILWSKMYSVMVNLSEHLKKMYIFYCFFGISKDHTYFKLITFIGLKVYKL